MHHISTHGLKVENAFVVSGNWDVPKTIQFDTDFFGAPVFIPMFGGINPTPPLPPNKRHPGPPAEHPFRPRGGGGGRSSALTGPRFRRTGVMGCGCGGALIWGGGGLRGFHNIVFRSIHSYIYSFIY